MQKMILRIKRRESAGYRLLHDLACCVRGVSPPSFLRPGYRCLYYMRQLLLGAGRTVVTAFYLKPMFESCCQTVGAHLTYVKLSQAFPHVSGNIRISLGSNVTLHSRSTFAAGRVFDEPQFIVGDSTYLGPGLSISVAREIRVGSHCLISSEVSISDNDGHPLDPSRRRSKELVSPDDVASVLIGDDVWVGQGALILKGVVIGDGAVVAARSVVTKSVEPYTVVAGNPAVCVKSVCNSFSR